MFLHINSEFAHLNHRQLNNQLILLFPAIKSCRKPGTTAIPPVETTKEVRASVVVVAALMAAVVMVAMVAKAAVVVLLLLMPVHKGLNSSLKNPRILTGGRRI
jgi:hypothetical protein